MNGAAVSAPSTTAASTTPSTSPAGTAGAAAANDGAGKRVDFAALLGGGAAADTGTGAAVGADASPAADVDAGADAKADSPQAEAADDASADAKTAAPADTTLPDWLLALRGSLTLAGVMFAPPATLAAKPGLATSAPNKSSATSPAATNNAATAAATGDAPAVAALMSADEPQGELAADPSTPTADRKFDALLAMMDEQMPAATGISAAATPAHGALAATLGAASAAKPTPTPTTAVSAPPMTVPPDHPQFTNDLGERIVWITDAGLSSARIELHPLDLGSLSVHVQLRGDEAQVSFAADNPATRALLQDSLPQLRELMSVQGLQLLRAQVEQKVGATRSSDTAFSQSHERDGRGEGVAPLRRVTRLKLVDAYV